MGETKEYIVTTRTYAIGILKTSNNWVYSANDDSEITPDDFKNGTGVGVYYSWDKDGNLIEPGLNDPINGVYFDRMCVPLHVLNAAGSELPSTGGIGNTTFYVMGGLLVIGAGVFFITRKRMSTRR